MFDPRSTIQGWVNGVPVGGVASFSHQLYFWQDHSEFIFWPLSLFQLIWPHPVTIKWLQDLAVFGAEVVAFRWITELAATSVPTRREQRAAAMVVAVGAVLLAVDPGFIAGNSFDVHTEAFAAFAALGTAHALYYGRRTVWLWLIAGLACGDVGAAYEAAIGLSALVLGRRWLRTGLLIIAGAVGWDAAARADRRNRRHAGLGRLREPDEPDPAAQPAGAAEHRDARGQRPAASRQAHLDALDQPPSAWKNISPAGIFGWLWLPVLIPAVLVLGQSQLSGVWDIYVPGFQSVEAYALIPVGTVAILLAALRSLRSPVRMLAVDRRGRARMQHDRVGHYVGARDDSPLVGACPGGHCAAPRERR